VVNIKSLLTFVVLSFVGRHCVSCSRDNFDWLKHLGVNHSLAPLVLEIASVPLRPKRSDFDALPPAGKLGSAQGLGGTKGG